MDFLRRCGNPPLPHFQTGRADAGQCWTAPRIGGDWRTFALVVPSRRAEAGYWEVDNHEFTGFHTELPVLAVVAEVCGQEGTKPRNG